MGSDFDLPVITKNIGVLGAARDERPVTVLILLVLGAPIYELLPLRWTGLHLLAQLLVLLS